MIRAQPGVLRVDFIAFELLAAGAIPTRVTPLVDVAVVVDLLDELSATLLVPFVAGLDERVVADVEGVPDGAELAGHVVAVLLHVAVLLGRLAGDFVGVLVVAHEEEDIEAFHAAVAGLDVGADLLEGGADVRPAVGVVDGGGQEKRRQSVHGYGTPHEGGRTPIL